MVWRRTGEICLVGKEFSLLTQWQRDVLLSKKTYIYEVCVHFPAGCFSVTHHDDTAYG